MIARVVVVPKPVVNDPQWPRNAVDRFILGALETKGFTLNPEADRSTLIRRVSFDLTPGVIGRNSMDSVPRATQTRALLPS